MTDTARRKLQSQLLTTAQKMATCLDDCLKAVHACLVPLEGLLGLSFPFYPFSPIYYNNGSPY